MYCALWRIKLHASAQSQVRTLPPRAHRIKHRAARGLVLRHGVVARGVLRRVHVSAAHSGQQRMILINVGN